MRSASFVLGALLIATSVGVAQPPSVPGRPINGQPVQSVPPSAAPTQADPRLDAHLGQWEKKMASVSNMRTEISLKRTDVVFKKETHFTGVVLCMKPNYAILRLDNATNKNDYEAFICDGKTVYAYNGLQKLITKIDISKNQKSVDNLMLDFLAGMKAKDVKERFSINLFKTDEHYIYLDIKPLRPADQREFKQLRLALYGPGAATAKVAYLPAKVYMLKPNDDTETWTFTNSQVDIPGVETKAFQFVPIKDKSWKIQEAPQQPAGGPTATPTGGAVRGNR